MSSDSRQSTTNINSSTASLDVVLLLSPLRRRVDGASSDNGGHVESEESDQHVSPTFCGHPVDGESEIILALDEDDRTGMDDVEEERSDELLENGAASVSSPFLFRQLWSPQSPAFQAYASILSPQSRDGQDSNQGGDSVPTFQLDVTSPKAIGGERQTVFLSFRSEDDDLLRTDKTTQLNASLSPSRSRAGHDSKFTIEDGGSAESLPNDFYSSSAQSPGRCSSSLTSPLQKQSLNVPFEGIQVVQATVQDADGIMALTAVLDMTNATSFVWPREELIAKLRDQNPLIVVAKEWDDTKDEAIVVGVAGIDATPCTKAFPTVAVERLHQFSGDHPTGICGDEDSKDTSEPTGEQQKSMSGATPLVRVHHCRGLLVHPEHQGKGIGGQLQKARLDLLRQTYYAKSLQKGMNFSASPSRSLLSPGGTRQPKPKVVLSARGVTLENTLDACFSRQLLLSPSKRSTDTDISKSTVLGFTYPTSKGIVHMVHGKPKWYFVGVDEADGGPVWEHPLSPPTSQHSPLSQKGYTSSRNHIEVPSCQEVGQSKASDIMRVLG